MASPTAGIRDPGVPEDLTGRVARLEADLLRLTRVLQDHRRVLRRLYLYARTRGDRRGSRGYEEVWEWRWWLGRGKAGPRSIRLGVRVPEALLQRCRERGRRKVADVQAALEALKGRRQLLRLIARVALQGPSWPFESISLRWEGPEGDALTLVCSLHRGVLEQSSVRVRGPRQAPFRWPGAWDGASRWLGELPPLRSQTPGPAERAVTALLERLAQVAEELQAAAARFNRGRCPLRLYWYARRGQWFLVQVQRGRSQALSWAAGRERVKREALWLEQQLERFLELREAWLRLKRTLRLVKALVELAEGWVMGAVELRDPTGRWRWGLGLEERQGRLLRGVGPMGGGEMPRMRKQVLVRMTESDWARVQAEAKRRRLSVSAFIRQAVMGWIEAMASRELTFPEEGPLGDRIAPQEQPWEGFGVLGSQDG